MTTPTVAALSRAITEELARPMALPAPRPYRDVSAREYAAWPACRYSALHEMDRSPLHARHLIDHGRSSEAIFLGSAVHCRVLEPAAFGERYVFKPLGMNLATKEGRAWKANVPPGVDILSTVDGHDAESLVDGMAQALFDHEDAAALLFGPGGANEVSLLWDEAGLPCKRRVDRVAPVDIRNGVDSRWQGTAIVELKTARDARPWAFGKQAEELGYYGAAWFSLRGAEVLCGPGWRRYFWVVVESMPPHGVYVHEPTEDDLVEAEKETRALLARYAECVRTNTWPGYPTGVNPLRRPAYARHQREDE